MNGITKAKIERFIISQLFLVVDGMVLMTSGKMYFKILLLITILVLVCLNVYDYYEELKKNEILEKLEDEKGR